MKAHVIKDCNYAFNDYDYQRGDVVDVTELGQSEKDYGINYEDTMDWIPKESVEIFAEQFEQTMIEER